MVKVKAPTEKIDNRDDFIEAHLNYVRSRLNYRLMYLVDWDNMIAQEIKRAREAYNENYKTYVKQPDLNVRTSIVARMKLLQVLANDFEQVLLEYKKLERDL